MIKKLTYSIILLLSTLGVHAQDLMTKKNGEQIKVHVVKVDRKSVVYIRSDDPEFTNYNIPKAELKRIDFENGDVNRFDVLRPFGYIMLTSGMSGATGNFALKEFNTLAKESGFATKGLYNQLQLGVYLKRNWGMVIGLMGWSAAFDHAGYRQAILSGGSLDSNELLFAGGSAWNGGGLMYGPLYSKVLNEHFTLDFKLTGGLCGIGKGEWFTTYQVDNGSVVSTYLILDTHKPGSGFAFQSGTTLRYAPGKRVAFTLTTNYFRHAFRTTISRQEYFNANALSVEESFKKKYIAKTIQIGLGVAIQFNRKKD